MFLSRVNVLCVLSEHVYDAGRSAPFVRSYMIGREDKRTNKTTVMFPALKTMQRQVIRSIESRAFEKHRSTKNKSRQQISLLTEHCWFFWSNILMILGDVTENTYSLNFKDCNCETRGGPFIIIFID